MPTPEAVTRAAAVKPAPYSRRTNPTVTAQLAEAWRLAQSAAATAERVHLTTELTAAASVPSEEHRQAVAATKADWQDKITQCAHAKLVYTVHVQAVLTTTQDTL